MESKKSILMLSIVFLVTSLIWDVFFMPKTALAAEKSTLSGPISEYHIHNSKSDGKWDGSLSGGVHLLKSVNTPRAKWHASKTPEQQLIVGLDNENYTPPKGWKIVKVLEYPVYVPRTYAISEKDCEKDKTCRPKDFEPNRPENKWAVSYVEDMHWEQYTRAETWEGKKGPFLIFRAMQVRRTGGDGLGGPGSKIWYKYDFIIEKEKKDPPKPETPGPSCPPPDIIGGELRYDFEIDLAVIHIEGETVERNTNTTTPVKVYREDFSENREKVKQEIKEDINRAKQEKKQLEAELKALEAELKTLQSQLAEAQRGYQVEVCNEFGCYNETRYDYGLIASLQSQIEAKKKEIEKKKCEIGNKEAEIKGYEKELKDLLELEEKYRVIKTKVVLTWEGQEVGSKSVSLVEGQTLELEYVWPLPGDGTIQAEINPNRDLGIDETTYSNNALDTPIYVASHATAACSKPGGSSYIKGIVRTIKTPSSSQILYEHITGTIVNQSRKSMRAGYGFSYDVQTVYTNEDPKSKAYGTQKTESYFSSLADYLPYMMGEEGYIVNMDLTHNQASAPPRNETKIWSLPLVMVEEKSGHVFDLNYLSHPKHNQNENMLDGGRKWYVPFLQPDGIYSFTSRGFDAGVNKLNVCMTGEVEIKGSFIGDPNGNDDFVRRTISPNNPFPGGIGWNWAGKVEQLTKLQPWWNNPPNRDSFTAPNNFEECYILDQEAINQVKEYNKRYGIEFDSYMPNGGRFWKEVGGSIKSCSRVP